MVVEIKGIGFVNKGAELMLYAIKQQLPKLLDDVTLAASLDSGTYQERSEAGLGHLAWVYSSKLPKAGGIVRTSFRLLPLPLRRHWNIVYDRQIDAILDASGLLYTDKWGAVHSELAAARFKQARKAGKKVILLPQAFGPFANGRVRHAVEEILANADLVYARDSVSYNHLLKLNDQAEHIKLAPDFSNLVEGRLPEYSDALADRPCLIPNYRMIDKTTTGIQENYLPFLTMSAEYLLDKGLRPFILIHEGKSDHKLAQALQAQLSQPVDIIHETDPLYIKGILGRCSLVIGSRYHGLVSALSQGILCLGTGWSHKYQMLFAEYNCPDCLVDLQNFPDDAKQKLDMVTEKGARTAIATELLKAGAEQKKRTQHMWQEVQQALVGSL